MAVIGNAPTDKLLTASDIDPSFVLPLNRGGTGGTDLKTINSASIVGTGNITITASSVAPPIVLVASSPQTAVVNTHYVITNASLTNINLPQGSTLTNGDVIWITNTNALLTNTVTPNAADAIHGGTVGEALTLNTTKASVQLRWIDTTNDWRII